MSEQRAVRRGFKHGLFGASFLLLAGAAFAGDMPRGNRGCDSEQHGPPGPPPMVPGFGPGFADDRPPPYLMDAALSDDQQDKMFSIMHTAAPEIRERSRAARKAREGLRELGQSAEFDSGKAAALAQALAAAESQLALLMARTDHDIYLVLTPEQRAHLAERARDRASHPHEGPPPPR